MGWNYPNPIYMYPRRKRRPQCSKCIYKQGNLCYQRTYQGYDSAELEGNTNRKCKYFKEGTPKERIRIQTKRRKEAEKAIESTSCCMVMSVLGIGYEYELNLIRKWRDNFLKKSCLGRAFIKFYYHRFSPFMIRLINDRTYLKKIVQYNLLFFIRILELYYK